MSDEQLVFLDEAVAPIARRTDPETSHDAAASMVTTASAHRAKIAAALRQWGPMTYVEIAEACGLEPVAVARRLAECAQLGLARRTRETRETPSGRNAHVWEAA